MYHTESAKVYGTYIYAQQSVAYMHTGQQRYVLHVCWVGQT